MQFCTDCGAVLNIFEFPDEELCFSCRKIEISNSAPPSPTTPEIQENFSVESLKNATLCHENNQIILRSPEGWVLWSGPDSTITTLEKVIKRAERILEIRQRRKKKA